MNRTISKTRKGFQREGRPRRRMKPRSVVDLFCGAGGASTGAALACEQLGMERPSLVAINHWSIAVQTHQLNHPWADHHCCRVESLDPRQVVPGSTADLIVAGVECTHHSQARGGKPMSDQSRASAWSVLHWAEQLRAKDILIENVPEFMSWGPLNAQGRPIKSRKGETFRALLQALESLNYRVDWRVINAADYGDPQRRRRLFLRARANRRAIEWPDTTHEEGSWRTAREILDWSDLGSSIFSRKRPLAARTIARIAEGIKRYAGEYSEAFLQLLHTGKVDPKALPASAMSSPFLVPRYGERPTQAPRTHSVDDPIPTITGTNAPQLVTPFILPHDQWTQKNGLMVDDVDSPMRTVTAHNGRNNKLVSPFILPYYRTGVAKSVDNPVDTVTTKDRFALVTPDGTCMDIYFRMLSPRELARAQSFPEEFQFLGTKGEQIKQIGNAVPVSTATALCRSVLRRAA
jgi:DNA (cytosine-5)-methyltransferase 1